MAKLSVTVIATVTLFLFSLTLSHARMPLNLPGNDVINPEIQNPLPKSDVNPTIRLPNEEASNDEPHVDFNTVTVTTVPLKFVKFRPINRQVYTLRSTFPFRRCRGLRHRNHRNFRPLGQRVEIPYGDDMIQSSGENSDFDLMNFHGGVRQIPPRSVRFHHHHHHHDEDEEREEATKHEKKRKQGGLFKRFRKFLNQFEF